MPRIVNTVVTNHCDTCGKEEEEAADTSDQNSWRIVYPAPEDGDMFCSWGCLALFATEKDRVEKEK